MKFLKLSLSLQLAFFLIASYGWSGPKVQKSFFDIFRITRVDFGTEHSISKGNDIYDENGNLGIALRFKKQDGPKHDPHFLVVSNFNGVKKELPLENVALPTFQASRDNFYLYGDSRKWSQVGVFTNGDWLVTSPSVNRRDSARDFFRRVSSNCISVVANFGVEVVFEVDGGELLSGTLYKVNSKDSIEVFANQTLYTVGRRAVRSFDGRKVKDPVVANTRYGFSENVILGFSFEKAELGTLSAIFGGSENLPLENIAFTTGPKPDGAAVGQRVDVPDYGLGVVRGWYADNQVLVAFDSGEYEKVKWSRRYVISDTADAVPVSEFATARQVALPDSELLKK